MQNKIKLIYIHHLHHLYLTQATAAAAQVSALRTPSKATSLSALLQNPAAQQQHQPHTTKSPIQTGASSSIANSFSSLITPANNSGSLYQTSVSAPRVSQHHKQASAAANPLQQHLIQQALAQSALANGSAGASIGAASQFPFSATSIGYEHIVLLIPIPTFV